VLHLPRRRNPSLSIYRERRAFRCFACDARGGNVLALEMLRSGADFKSAARAGCLAMSTPAILEGALLAQAAGFAVHYQRGKRAFEPCWSTSPPKIAEELRQDYRDGYNIGFRTGDWSKLDGWPVVVLDADICSDDPAHREATREAWRELVGDMKPTVKTGGGGAHLCLRCPPDKLPLDQSIGTRAKIVSIEVGISGFLFNLSSWYFSLKFGILWMMAGPPIYPWFRPGRSPEYFDNPIAQDRRSIELRFGPMLGFQQFRSAPIRGYQTRRTGNNRFVASVEGRRHALNFDSSPCRATTNRNESATRRLSKLHLRRPRFSSR
jgi:hypothetical protein